MRPRQIASVALVLTLVVAGFVVARLVTERDARRDSEHSAELRRRRFAAASRMQRRSPRACASSCSTCSGTGVTSAESAQNALRRLSPAGFPAAAWVERVPDSRRAAYERRIGQRIVTPDESRSVVPVRSRHLPTTLVSGFDPMDLPGLDLGGEQGMIPALARATRRDGVVATPVAPRRGGAQRALPGRAGAEPRRRGTPPWRRRGLRAGNHAARGRQGDADDPDRVLRCFDGRPGPRKDRQQLLHGGGSAVRRPRS